MDFLKKFSGQNSIVTIWTIRNVLWLSWDVEQVLVWHRGENLYFRVWVSSALAWEKETLEANKIVDSDIVEINRIFIDLDIRKMWKEHAAEVIGDKEILDLSQCLVALMNNHPLFSQWTYVVFSGNGLHVYYIGNHVVMTPEKYSSMVAMFYEMFDSEILAKNASLSMFKTDKSCKNISRLSRLVWSFNYNRKQYWLEPCEVKILQEQNVSCDYLSDPIKYLHVLDEGMEEQDPPYYSADEKMIYKEMRKEFIDYICKKLWLYIKPDGRNFGGWHNTDNKGFFLHEKVNKLVGSTDSYIKPADVWYYTFVSLVMELEKLTDREKACEYILKHYPKQVHNTNVKVFDGVSPDLTKVYRFTRGLRCINEEIWKFDIGQLILLIGKTWIGKTQYTFFCAMQNTLLWNKTVYITLEMSPEKLAERYARQKSWIDKIQRSEKTISPEQIQAFRKHYDYIAGLENLKIVSVENTAIDLVEKAIKDFFSQWYQLFFIDNLGFFSWWGDELERFAEVGRRLKTLTNELPISIVLLHHMKKGSKIDEFKPWSTSEIRGNQKLADDSDKIVQVWRNIDPSLEDRNEASMTSLIMHKDREFWDPCIVEFPFKDGEYLEPS